MEHDIGLCIFLSLIAFLSMTSSGLDWYCNGERKRCVF